MLQRVGKRKDGPSGQVALGWLLAKITWLVPIPGTTKLTHLKKNLGAHEVNSNAQDVKELEDGFASIVLQGARAPEVFRAPHDIGLDIGTSSKGGHGITPLPPDR